MIRKEYLLRMNEDSITEEPLVYSNLSKRSEVNGKPIMIPGHVSSPFTVYHLPFSAFLSFSRRVAVSPLSPRRPFPVSPCRPRCPMRAMEER